jgi:formate dehydrogenase major subunit
MPEIIAKQELRNRGGFMGVSRRDFLKLAGGSIALGTAGVALTPEQAAAQGQTLRIEGAKQTTTVCPYCSVGCSILIHSKDGKVINVEGDPDSPINEGTLCPKGASLFQMANNETRLTKPLYRAAGAADWKEVEWGWALDQIARKVKDTREKTFVATAKNKIKEKQPDGTEVEVEKELTVNRTEGIAHIGSAAMDNEECYLMQKLVRSWGVAWIEHQARI